MILYKEKSFYSGNCMERMFTTMEKKGLDIKNTPDYVQYADA